MKFSPENPRLRKAAKRYAKSQPHKQHIWFLPTLKPNAEKPKELALSHRT